MNPTVPPRRNEKEELTKAVTAGMKVTKNRCFLLPKHMGGSINGGTPKCLVYKDNSHLEMDDLGAPPFQETLIY